MLTNEKFELWYRQLTEPTPDLRLSKDDMRMCWNEAYRLGHAAGVAAERKRCAEVCRKKARGEHNEDYLSAELECAQAIERGEDV